ncbi:J domain-containing protein [Steroidobacter sp. S1-65]|uniref:J domain-containing protein n=1 Tax=Steroidobacter gossypii TaxID=2805490 RepID=A0ABS1WQF4_9GAMM|nr:J domain-containing protein [Steroidobacter gossypii]MBM0103203.1 J domain-containing protein [Steroidobacter gossypii]
MSRKSLVHLPRKAARETASPDQVRFRYLIDRIEKAKRARADWDELVVEFKATHAERIHPLQGTLRQLTRDTVFLIDQLLDQKGWSRVDREALKDIARHTASMLLDVNPNDVEMRTIFDRHSAMSFQEKKQEEIEGLKEHAKEYMGIDLDDAEIESEEDLIERVYERMKEDEARRQERSSERPKSKRQERAEASAQNAKQVLREIYRKLASAVHPDREADAARRAEKNELMQQINRAYATNDLFTLLEAQMRLELIDPDHASKISGERLRQFNRLLSQQLESATEELRSLQSAFRVDYDIPYSRTITARDLHLATQRRAREIRAHIQQQKRFLEVLANKSATKRWLKEQRRFDDDWDEDEY